MDEGTLRPGSTGDDVADLHRALRAVGIEIADDELEERRFGDTTLAAVTRLQTLIGMPATGVVDRATLDLARLASERLRLAAGPAIGPAEPAADATVEGPVTDAAGLPLRAAVVVASIRDLRSAREIGRAQTDDLGQYRIAYTVPAFTPGPADPPDAALPDLQFDVLDAAGRRLATSPVQFHVPHRAVIPLSVGGGPAAPAELDRVREAVTARLGQLRPEELVENADHQDLTFLAGDTELSITWLAFYTVAARLEHTTQLPVDLFYALFRQHVPADAAVRVLATNGSGIDLDRNAARLLDAVLAASAEARATAVEAALSHGIVPAAYAARAKEDLARLGTRSVDAALGASTGMGKTAIRDVLAAAAVPDAKQRLFIELYAAATGPTRAFWSSLAQNPAFTKQDVADLRFTTNVGRFSRGHLPLVSALIDMRKTGKIAGPRDLARLTAADWKAMLTEQRPGGPIGIPPNFTARDHGAAIDAYASLLERNFERAYPTAAFSARLAADAQSPLPAKAAVTTFLDANPGFDLRKGNLDRYVRDNPGALTGDQAAAARQSLLTSQRLLKLTSRYAAAKPLLADGIQSARHIYAMGQSRFTQTYAAHPEIGATVAARIYGVAEQTYALSLSLATRLNAQFRAIDPAAIAPPPPAPAAAPALPAGPPPPKPKLADFPNLETLFGSFDLCACTHCQSVLSPAAYLADMLRFLSHRMTGGKSAKTVLLERRPDLVQIELSCRNTETVLPYIDLVNELLEDAVAPPVDPTAAARARQTTRTTDELNASPQYVNQQAYVELAQAVHPWILPFDLPLSHTRTWLGQLGTTRAELMRTLARPPALPSAQATAAAVEALGFSAVEADIVTGGPLAAANHPWDYWGLAETGNAVADPVDGSPITGTWLQVLAHVQVLLDRAALTHQTLTWALTTRFVNPNGTIEIVCSPPDSCDLATMTVTGLTQDALERLHRFTRLQRRLGWDPFELDAAIALLRQGVGPGLPQLDATLLRQLAAVTAAMRRFQLPATSAAAFFARLDTHDVPLLPGEDSQRFSLYHRLFLDPAVLSPIDPTFALNADGTEIAAIATGPRLADHHATLVAAFEVSDADLSLAIDGMTDGKLTLANLSALYRGVLLANGLGVTMKELLTLKALAERELDTAPFFEAVDPFDPARPEMLEWFCELAAAIRGTRFQIAQLDYLLRHVFDQHSGVAPDDVATGTLLKALRDGLIKIAAENPDAAVRHTLGSGLVVQRLAEALGLPTATAAQLVTSWFRSSGDASRPMVEDFLALPGVARDPARAAQPVARDEAGFGPYFTAYATLDKAAQVINGFAFTTDEVAWLQAHGAALGWLDLTKLPLTAAASPGGGFASWRRTAAAAAVRTALPAGGAPFTGLMDLAQSGASKAAYLTALGQRTKWSAADLLTLAGDPASAADRGLLQLAYPDDYRSERALARLLAAFTLLRRLGASAADASGWTGAAVTAAQADAVRQSVKAKCTRDDWPGIAKPLQDVLREQQRDALVAYLLAHQPPPGVKRWHEPNDVYAYYLIDVEMSAVQGTSRIVQANASIQLFVQRCILNLEPEVTVDATADVDWLQWRWMSHYRVWEANWKVFLWPENVTEPALRHDKSPFFKDLENDLLQSEVTTDSAEDAFRSYLAKLDAVARLDVASTYYEPGPPARLHVVARRQGDPPTHYYRQWVDSSRWTAWTKVDLDIVSDHVLPVVWNRRLYLFWAIVQRKPDRAQTQPPISLSGSKPPDTRLHLEVQLAWSELKGQKWQARQTAPQTIVVPWEGDPFQVTLKSSIQAPLLRIDLFSDEPFQSGRRHVAEFVLGGVGNAVEAFAVSTSGLTQVGPDTRAIGTLAPALVRPALGLPTNTAYDAMSMVPTVSSALDSTRPRVSPCSTTYDLYGTLTSEVVLNQADRYRLLVPHQTPNLDSTLPFFFQDGKRSYFLIPQVYYQNGNYFTQTAPAYVYHPFFRAEYQFLPFYHAFVPLFIRELNRGGVDQLYRRELQADPAGVQGVPAFDFAAYYAPTDRVIRPYPGEGVDFDYDAGYAIYSWELFFHAPFQIAESLSQNRRFEDAKHWYEHVFDPTSTANEPAPQRYWVTKPFHDLTAADYQAQQIVQLTKLINAHDPVAEHQVAVWRANPFDPHVIAELRPVAYQRAIVMKYLDNLIAWGDQLFRQDTMEAVNEATQLYVLAAELYGPKQEIVQHRQSAPAKTYAELESSLDGFADAITAAENAIPPVKVNVPVDPSTPKLPVVPPLYFCVPPNEKLLGYWDTIADRLFKIRHGLNIEGVARQLALFAPPIDPALLVQAAAAGLDLGSVLSDTSAALPPYRFRVMLREALDLATEVRSLGAELLSVLEKRDAEALGLLRSGSERKLQDAVLSLRERMMDEAAQQLDVLDKTRQVAVERQNYYAARKDELTNAWEAAALVLTGGSVVAQAVALGLESASGAAHIVVDAQFGGSGAGGSPHVTVKFGGPNVGRSSAGFARAARVTAALLQTGAAMSTVLGGYQRRQDEMNFQFNVASRELDVIASQKVAATIRQDLVKRERDNQEQIARLASDTDDFLRGKFTNEELFDWSTGQTSATHFQAYGLAYAVAKRAELCFRRELGLADSSFIQFGYWDSLKKGLLAGDKLVYDLHRMEAAYLAQNARELELTRHASLLQIDPYALVKLRATGECIVTLPELWFDVETPGHFMRRLKTVAVTVPCVVGPYGGVSMTLTLLDNHVRTSSSAGPPYPHAAGDDPRFVDDPGGVSAVVTSSGQSDSGLFELSFQDDRYLPFEGTGAVSTWRLKLNAVYPQFDYRTISDVILHLRYTARDGGQPLAAAAADNVRTQLNSVALAESRHGLYRLVSARHEHGSAWQKFLSPGAAQDQVLTLETPPDRFPFFTNGMDLKVTGIDVVGRLTDPGDYALVLTPPGGAPINGTMSLAGDLGGLHHFAAHPLAPAADLGRAPSAGPAPAWTIELKRAAAADFRSLTAAEIDDLVLVLQYTVTP